MPYNHFANVQSSIVVNTIIADQDFINNSGVVGDPNNWIETDFNTRGNIHYTTTATSNDRIMIPDGGVPFRGNYGYVGFTYDTENDVFYAPQPFPSWNLNSETWMWEAPTPRPSNNGKYIWDEINKDWKNISPANTTIHTIP